MYGCTGKYRGSSPNLVQLVRARGLEHLRPYSCKKISFFLILHRMWDCTESRLTGRKPPILCWLVYFVLKVWFVSPVYRSCNERDTLSFYYYKSCTKEQKCKIFFSYLFCTNMRSWKLCHSNQINQIQQYIRCDVNCSCNISK